MSNSWTLTSPSLQSSSPLGKNIRKIYKYFQDPWTVTSPYRCLWEWSNLISVVKTNLKGRKIGNRGFIVIRIFFLLLFIPRGLHARAVRSGESPTFWPGEELTGTPGPGARNLGTPACSRSNWVYSMVQACAWLVSRWRYIIYSRCIYQAIFAGPRAGVALIAVVHRDFFPSLLLQHLLQRSLCTTYLFPTCSFSGFYATLW